MNYQAVIDKLIAACHEVKELNNGKLTFAYPIGFKALFSQTHLSLKSTPAYQEMLRQVYGVLPSIIKPQGSRSYVLNPNVYAWVKLYQSGDMIADNATSISHRVAAHKLKTKADPITRLVELKSARESMEAEIRDMQAKVDSIKAQQIEIMKEFIG